MKPAWFPDWQGASCVIVAAGPSAAETELLRARSTHKFIVINESWRLAPWADVLYAADNGWWSARRPTDGEFEGLRVTADYRAEQFGVKLVSCLRGVPYLQWQLGTIGWGGNSGFQAINLAAQFGATRLILVGYDLRVDRGVHWHGAHPKGLSNPKQTSVDLWRRNLDRAADVLKARGVEVINTSEVSMLTAYPKVPFAEAVL